MFKLIDIDMDSNKDSEMLLPYHKAYKLKHSSNMNQVKNNNKNNNKKNNKKNNKLNTIKLYGISPILYIPYYLQFNKLFTNSV